MLLEVDETHPEGAVVGGHLLHAVVRNAVELGAHLSRVKKVIVSEKVSA